MGKIEGEYLIDCVRDKGKSQNQICTPARKPVC